MKQSLATFALTLILASASFFPTAYAEESQSPDIVFSAGREGGGYWGVAQRLKEVAAESGLNVLVKESAGSIQNLERLTDPDNEVNLTLAQADAIEHYLQDHPELASSTKIMESIGLECVFLITSTESGIETINDLFGDKTRRIAISSPESGVAITYRHMAKLLPELAATEPVYTDTLLALKSMIENRPVADAVMLVHRPKVRTKEVSTVLDDPAHFRFVSIEDARLVKPRRKGNEAPYSFLDVPLVRGEPGEAKSIPTVCTQGRLLAARDKLTSGQLDQLQHIMDFQWMRIYPTAR